jgi:hypothetical protein
MFAKKLIAGHSVQKVSSFRLVRKHLNIKMYDAVILPVAFSGCFQNRVLSRIFRHKREDVTGGWRCRRLLKEELHNLCSPN